MPERNEMRYKFNKYISILYRLSYPFYDRELDGFNIGSGQQFFLLTIKDKPGISMLELAGKGHYDKGTTNRAVMKLAAQEYIRIVTDAEDKRIRRLYLTEKAEPILNATLLVGNRWSEAITEGLSTEEKVLAEQLLKKMSKNAQEFMKDYRKKGCIHEK